jgi:DivIVA domain-containing protein
VNSGSDGWEPTPNFGIVLRGYERRQVEKYIDRVRQARQDGQPLPADGTSPKFTIVLRGYDREEVDEYISQLIADA